MSLFKKLSKIYFILFAGKNKMSDCQRHENYFTAWKVKGFLYLQRILM